MHLLLSLPNEIIAFFQIPSHKYNLQFNIIYSLSDGLDGIEKFII